MCTVLGIGVAFQIPWYVLELFGALIFSCISIWLLFSHPFMSVKCLAHLLPLALVAVDSIFAFKYFGQIVFVLGTCSS